VISNLPTGDLDVLDAPYTFRSEGQEGLTRPRR